MSSLCDFIKEINENDIQFLPLFHSCPGSNAEEIFINNELKATTCKVFEKDLLYFFYGKPSYPVSEKISKQFRTDTYACPVCFVYNIDKIDICGIHPFDTGAYLRGMYSTFSINGDKEKLYKDYYLGNDKNEIKKYITVFYSNNDNYLRGTPTKCHIGGRVISIENKDSQKESEIEPSIVKLIRLLNCDGEFDFDERSRTIEVMTEKSIDIIDSVELIIMPDNLAENKNVKEFLDNNKDIEYKTYYHRPLAKADRFNEAVFQKMIEYMKEKGLLNE